MKKIQQYRPLTIVILFLFWVSIIVGITIYVDEQYKPQVSYVSTIVDIASIMSVTSVNDTSNVKEESLSAPKYTKPVISNQTANEIHITSKDVIFISDRERTCLIRNVFYEAGAEPYLGKIAVAQVTWNRLKEGKWGNDICKVVYAPSQFSWTADSRKRNAKVDTVLWINSIQAVDDFINGTRIVRLEKSLYFHATYVRPNWSRFAEHIKQIGNHIFYAQK
jgi:spore germination cell wall hydrolase CwlJ-like protein